MAVKAVLRRLVLLAIWFIGDVLLASVLGPRLWPTPLAFIYKVVDSFDFKFSRNGCHCLRYFVDFRLLNPIIVIYLASAAWWWHVALLCLLYNYDFKWTSARKIFGAIGLFFLASWSQRIRFAAALVVLDRRDPLSPAALGTLLVHTARLPLDYDLADIAWTVACEALVVWLVCWVGRMLHSTLLSRIRFSTETHLEDRLIAVPFTSIWRWVSRDRLVHELSWILRELSAGKLTRNARVWIANRVEEETLKMTENQLDCFVRADMLKQTPTFEENVMDIEDLDFLCSEKSDVDPQKRPLGEVFVESVSRVENTERTRKHGAIDALAYLSFVKGLNLDSAAQQRLGTELMSWSHFMLDEDEDFQNEFLLPALEGALVGLANLARGNAGFGTFLKDEGLFSIFAALLNPSEPLVRGFLLWGELEALELKPYFEERDPGYSQSDLSNARRRRRASSKHRDYASAGRQQAALPPGFDTIGCCLEATTTMNLICAYYVVSRFLGNLQVRRLSKSALLRKFHIGKWYRLLSLGVRLMSTLSTVESNHVWLLEQGALQALCKMLRLLPTNRMRSAQQEAALFVYRIFENHAMRTLIHKSPALKAAASEIVLELRAIDSDLFSEGWSHRIGRPLYGELIFAAPSTIDSEADIGREPTSSTTRQRPPSSSKRCSREGCQVERRHGVRLKTCAGCLQVRYCSKECQRTDYPSHKLVCKPS